MPPAPVMNGEIEFVPLSPKLVPACRSFNERLARAGADSVAGFGCTPNPVGDGGPPAPMALERFVGVDSGGEVRGAYALRWQSLWLRGSERVGAHYGYPVSEGVIDRRYAMVGTSVLRDAVRRCAHLYTLGADGRAGRVFGVGRHAGWAIEDVAFLFRIVNGGRFVRRLPQVRRRAERRAFAAVLGATGIAGIAARALHAGSAFRHCGSGALRMPSGTAVEEVATLGAAAEEVWARARSQYEFCVVRDGPHVEGSFPRERVELHRLTVSYHNAIVGWSVVMTQGLSRLRAHLGEVAPGLIVDVFGDTAHADAIVRAATSYLADRGVDVVITNVSHRAWMTAFRRAGFLQRPSQFPLIVSRALARELGGLHAVMPGIHMSRGDGDGVHYLH